MSLRLEVPEGALATARRWAVGLLCRRLAELPCTLVPTRTGPLRLTDGERSLELADAGFQRLAAAWGRPESLPTPPLPRWRLEPELARRAGTPELPVLGSPDADGRWWHHEGPRLVLAAELPTATFLWASRYEEWVRPERDAHGRFPAAASLAFAEGVLERPLLHEYAAVLRALAERLWPDLPPARRCGRVFPTYDMDEPWEAYGTGLLRALSRSAAELRRGRLRPALGRWRRIAATRLAGRPDGFDHDDWACAVAERAGERAAFFWLVGGRHRWDVGRLPALLGRLGGGVAGPARFEAPRLRRRLLRIAERGHEHGFHPSYRTAEAPALWRAELARLVRVVGPVCGGRQHFLRLRVPATWRLWAAAGLRYDASLGYAEAPGFRAGLALPYRPYDLERHTVLPISVRPLIVMDTTLLLHQGLAPEAALEQARLLRERTLRHGGEFVALAHPQYYHDPTLRRFWEELIAS